MFDDYSRDVFQGINQPTLNLVQDLAGRQRTWVCEVQAWSTNLHAMISRMDHAGNVGQQLQIGQAPPTDDSDNVPGLGGQRRQGTGHFF